LRLRSLHPGHTPGHQRGGAITAPQGTPQPAALLVATHCRTASTAARCAVWGTWTKTYTRRPRARPSTVADVHNYAQTQPGQTTGCLPRSARVDDIRHTAACGPVCRDERSHV